MSGPALVQAPRMAGYRKLVAFLALVACATVLQALGRFDATVATFLGGAFTVYVGGNAGEHFARARMARPFPPLPVRPNGSRPTAPVLPPAEVTAPRPDTPAVTAALAAGIDLQALRRELSTLEGGV